MCTGSVADPNGTSVQTLQVQLQLDGTRPASRETVEEMIHIALGRRPNLSRLSPC
ncbi:hypothetical protein PTTG_26047 [Puccinia triticina 1-1 BBBD Race 1]|uniref:Uncharacterized protein n=1 Tax=Puccinia triticina (isolate 1-1 / race 1 (BBBD)) TaxID=630390 RepID=A0A180GYT1_PUCT1|nr:hypothetical protein PTTG_26047 [Puccinia triticina 1-1 BBBD Race 1]